MKIEDPEFGLQDKRSVIVKLAERNMEKNMGFDFCVDNFQEIGAYGHLVYRSTCNVLNLLPGHRKSKNRPGC